MSKEVQKNKEIIGTVERYDFKGNVGEVVEYNDYQKMKKDIIDSYDTGEKITPKWTNKKMGEKMIKEIKEYFLGHDETHFVVSKAEVKKESNSLKTFHEYKTTKDIKLDDGSSIKKGTEFIIDGKSDNKLEVHFSENKDNRYTNDTGEYKFTEKEVRIFIEKEAKENKSQENTAQINDETEEKTAEEKEVAEENKRNKILNILSNVNKVRLELFPVQGNLDFKHLEKINKALSSDIAYRAKEINSKKIINAKVVLHEMKMDKFANSDEFVKNTAKNLGKLYKLNLFEKNNSETLKQFAKTYGMAAGFELDTNKMQEFNKGCVTALKTGKTDVLEKTLKSACKNIEPSKDIVKSFIQSITKGIER